MGLTAKETAWMGEVVLDFENWPDNAVNAFSLLLEMLHQRLDSEERLWRRNADLAGAVRSFVTYGAQAKLEEMVGVLERLETE